MVVSVSFLLNLPKFPHGSKESSSYSVSGKEACIGLTLPWITCTENNFEGPEEHQNQAEITSQPYKR